MSNSIDEDRKREILAHRFVQLFTETAIKQNLPMDKIAEGMLVEAVAILGVVNGDAGRAALVTLLRKTAETVETTPFKPVGRH